MTVNKQQIADICEELYKYSINKIPQIENDKLIWILNGSTLCNILYNVIIIDGKMVTEKFNNACFEFIRQPKGDMDILYTADKCYKLDFTSQAVINFQSISEEKRTYNFVDHNSQINEDDLNQICKMTTKSNFSFYAKKPQYLFIYKFKEFLAIFNKEILSGDIDSIVLKKKNMINDIIALYNIAINYCGIEELETTIDQLPNISEYLHQLNNKDKIMYNELIKKGLNIIISESIKINEKTSKLI